MRMLGLLCYIESQTDDACVIGLNRSMLARPSNEFKWVGKVLPGISKQATSGGMSADTWRLACRKQNSKWVPMGLRKTSKQDKYILTSSDPMIGTKPNINLNILIIPALNLLIKYSNRKSRIWACVTPTGEEMLSGCSEIDDAYNGPVRAIWDTLRSTAESSSPVTWMVNFMSSPTPFEIHYGPTFWSNVINPLAGTHQMNHSPFQQVQHPGRSHSGSPAGDYIVLKER
jgi:hypothetical protein